MLLHMRHIHISLLLILWILLLAACGDAPLDRPPQALINAPTYCDLGATIELDGSHSADPDDDIVLYRFYIADGAGVEERENPFLLYSCRTPGLIEILLEVVDSSGNTSSSRALISVRR